MKNTFLILFAFIGHCLAAQTSPYFDPERDPVAQRTDTDFQLIVSEYVLAKSLKASMGNNCHVEKTYKDKLADGRPCLFFEGRWMQDLHHFSIGIPLKPDAQQRLFYLESQAIVCSAPGCNNCSIYNGNCVGCCSSTSENRLSPTPLKKVQMAIDE